jgi:hypothetical protein
MTFKSKLVGIGTLIHLGSLLAGGLISDNLLSHFDYTFLDPTGITFHLTVEGYERNTSPKLEIRYGNSDIVAKDTDKDGALDEIVLNLNSNLAREMLGQFVTKEKAILAYKEIVNSKDYLAALQKRQEKGNSLFCGLLCYGMISLAVSNRNKYSNATQEQLNNPFFYCR